MPNPDYTSIQAAWINFTESVRFLVVPLQDDRPLDQYLSFRDSVFEIVKERTFLDGLNNAWVPFTDQPLNKIGNAVLLELNSFSLAIEVAKTTETNEQKPKTWIGKWLGRASTVSGSVGDIIDNLPPIVKGGLKLFGEMCDIFKG